MTAAPGVGKKARSRSVHRSALLSRLRKWTTPVVENGVWIRQNQCSTRHQPGLLHKGAALREHGHGEYRLRYPMKLVGGKYQRISWDVALDEISAGLLDLRKASGPDAVLGRLDSATTNSRI